MALFKNKDQLFAEPRRKLRELFAPQFVSPLAGSPEPKPFLERAKELFLPKPEPEEFISWEFFREIYKRISSFSRQYKPDGSYG